jgi:hypothetical protein
MAKRRLTQCSQEENSRRGSQVEHEKILRETLVTVGSLEFFRCWRNETGVGLTFAEPHRPFAYGLKGSGDIMGLMSPFGRTVAFEIKSGKATQRESQIRFEEMMTRLGGLYFVVRSAKEALEFLITAHNRDLELCRK